MHPGLQVIRGDSSNIEPAPPSIRVNLISTWALAGNISTYAIARTNILMLSRPCSPGGSVQAIRIHAANFLVVRRG